MGLNVSSYKANLYMNVSEILLQATIEAKQAISSGNFVLAFELLDEAQNRSAEILRLLDHLIY